jgi:hypothetical protein
MSDEIASGSAQASANTSTSDDDNNNGLVLNTNIERGLDGAQITSAISDPDSGIILHDLFSRGDLSALCTLDPPRIPPPTKGPKALLRPTLKAAQQATARTVPVYTFAANSSIEAVEVTARRLMRRDSVKI